MKPTTEISEEKLFHMTPDEFRGVRNLIETTVKELIATL